MTRFAKRVLYTHSFKTHLSSPFVSYINGPTYICLILLKVEQSAFTQASFLSMSDIHKCSCGLQMASSSPGKQTADCESLHDWLMHLSMDLTALCDSTFAVENVTNGSQLAVFG